nr:hypothetical protein [Sphingomonas bacterium]
MTETIPPVCARSRSEWLAAIENGAAPVPIGAALRLQQLLGFDWKVFVAVCAHAEGLGNEPVVCRVCACSEWDPCLRGTTIADGTTCAWAEPDLCTSCVDGGTMQAAA